MMEKIFEYLKCKSMDEIVEACNSIYEYRYITGVLNQNSIVRKMANETGFCARDICNAIEEYAAIRLKNTVKMLMLEKAHHFIDAQ